MGKKVNFRAYLERYATGRNILILLGLFLLFTLVIFPLLTSRLAQLSNGVSLIDNEFAYTPEKVFQMVTSYGPAGRPLYITITLTADLVYPINYALLLVLAMIYFFRTSFARDSIFQGWVYIPLAAMAADYLENICLVILLATYPNWIEGLAQAANIFTGLKWGLLLISILLTLVGLVTWLLKGRSTLVRGK
jgi:hypothetical protein